MFSILIRRIQKMIKRKRTKDLVNVKGSSSGGLRKSAIEIEETLISIFVFLPKFKVVINICKKNKHFFSYDARKMKLMMINTSVSPLFVNMTIPFFFNVTVTKTKMLRRWERTQHYLLGQCL